MLKVLALFLLISNAYSQVFTEDIAKINHVLSEQEVDHFVLKPGTRTSIDGIFFDSMALRKSLDPVTNCEEDGSKSKPLNTRYQVLAVTREEPKDPKLQPQTTVIIAKFEEKENPLVTDIKNMIATQVQTGSSGGQMGKFSIKQHRDAGQTVVLYAGEGTNIDVNSTVKAQGVMNVDVNPIFGARNSSSQLMTPTIQMDVVNKVSLSQDIGEGSAFKTSLESIHTTGVRGLESLNGTKFNLSTIKAQARVDAQLDRNVQSYSEVNYTTNTVDKEIRAVAGFDIKAPHNAQILVFTGYTNKSSSLANRNPASTGTSKEVGVEYKPKRGVSIYTKFNDGTDRRDKRIETGIKIQLGN